MGDPPRYEEEPEGCLWLLLVLVVCIATAVALNGGTS